MPKPYDDPTLFPFQDGEILTVTRGPFAGKVLQVDGRHSFFEGEWWDCGDKENGPYHPASWQIVLNIEVDGVWLYFVRASAQNVAFYTRKD